MFQKKDLLKGYLRERFYVTAPGVPPFTGLLINVAKANLEFADCKTSNQSVEGTTIVDRHPGTYLQRLLNVTG